MIFSGIKTPRTHAIYVHLELLQWQWHSSSRTLICNYSSPPAREKPNLQAVQSIPRSSALIRLQGFRGLVGVGWVDVNGCAGAIAARIDDPGVATFTVAVEVDHHNTDVVVEMPPHSPLDRPQVAVPDLPFPCCFLQGSLHQSVGYSLHKFVKI